MATLYAKNAGGNWTAAGTWSATSSLGGDSAGPPTAADDTIFDGNSGNVTINATAVARSVNCTGYTGTLTHAGSVTLSIGDGTAGASNIALKLVAGMTYTLSAPASSALSFVSTSATTQTITTGGKTLGNVTINGAGSSYQLADSCTTSATATVTLTAGSLDTNSQTCSWGIFASANTNTRSLTLGASSISITNSSGWSCSTNTNMTFSAGTSTITFTNAGTLNGGINFSYNNLVFSGAGTATITSSGGFGTGTIANLTRTGSATKTDGVFINTFFTVTGTLTLNGNSTVNRIWVRSNVEGAQRQITVNGSVSASNVDFFDILGAGSASWNLAGITGGSGDCGGNGGITFTTPAAQTWQGTSGGNWSDVSKWTSRVPLPQDDVIVSSAFSASQTITADMQRLGKSIDFTGTTGSPAFAVSLNLVMFGSLTLVSGMTITGAFSFCLSGRGGRTLTSAGVTFPNNLIIDTTTTAADKYTLQDDLTVTGSIIVGSTVFGINRGCIDTNGKTVTCAIFQFGNPSASGGTYTLTNSTINLTSTATTIVFNVQSTVAGSPASTLTATGSTINIVNASSGDRTVVAHGFTLGTLTYTVAGSTGRLILGQSGATGTMTIATLNFSDVTNARTLQIWAGTTIAITSAFNVNGTSGKLMSITSSTGGSTTTLTKSAGVVSCDYLSIQDSTAVGGAAWFAGANSTNVSNNTGWVFTAPPTTFASTRLLMGI